ncbi:MAG: MFS transporter, partial [Candidatus Binataceae bacterium]
FMSACVITTQVVITLIATPIGRASERWGRKPLLLIGFGVLPIRGVLYTLTASPVLLVAIQILDGIGAGIFGVVSILVIADVMQGTGRFNFAQGCVGTAVGIGASLSTAVAGYVVQNFGFSSGFLGLAGVALFALILLSIAMPETAASSDQ